MKKKPKLLDLEIFNLIVRHNPLISIDLIIANDDRKIMLGWRKNQPAKDHWFVPGGRVLKNESIRHAFQRISEAELGVSMNISQSEFLGIYEHFYPGENFSGEEGYGTHYIVMAFGIKIKKMSVCFPDEQHSSYQWFSERELLDDNHVHANTKNYFNGTVPVK